MDKFHSWEVGASDEDNCDTCGMNIDKSSGCCRDEVKTVKLYQDLSPASFISYHFALPALLASGSILFVLQYNNVELVKSYSSHSPPLLAALDLYSLNCVFRI